MTDITGAAAAGSASATATEAGHAAAAGGGVVAAACAARKRPVELAVWVDAGVPTHLMGDGARISQLIAILLSNRLGVGLGCCFSLCFVFVSFVCFVCLFEFQFCSRHVCYP